MPSPLELLLKALKGPVGKVASGMLGASPPVRQLTPGALSRLQQLTKLTGPMESHPDYVYHATNADRALQIAEEGKMRLYKPSAFTDQSSWPDGSVEKRNY